MTSQLSVFPKGFEPSTYMSSSCSLFHLGYGNMWWVVNYPPCVGQEHKFIIADGPAFRQVLLPWTFSYRMS